MIKIDSNVNILATAKEMIGRKEKYKVEINNSKYIIKLNHINYEIFAELIAEKLGEQVGIEMAHYHICDFNNRIGLITPVFLDDDEEEIIMSVKALLEHSQDLCRENNIKFDIRENTIENVLKAISVFDKTANLEDIAKELVKRWYFYGMIIESDKNSSNLSFIKKKDGTIRISPDYDNSTMARLNENVSEFIDEIRMGVNIYSLIDCTKSALKPEVSDCDEFINNYRSFVEDYGPYWKDILEEFKNLDVDKAIVTVEEENQISIPYEVKYWLRKVIGIRRDDMFAILNSKLSKEYIKTTNRN